MPDRDTDALAAAIAGHIAACVAEDTHTEADRALVETAEVLTRALALTGAGRQARLRRTITALGRETAAQALGISKQRLSQLAPEGRRREKPATSERTIRARAVRDYAEGMSLVDVGRRYGRRWETIGRWVDEAGVPRRYGQPRHASRVRTTRPG